MSKLSAMVDWARRKPERALAALLALHVIVWTVVPLVVCHNLQLDLIEDLALGREWQLGYWKHPPLPWWAADVLYRLTGSVYSVYLLGPLASAACFYGVWQLSRETVGAFRGLIAVVALEGIHFYNFSVVKFAHDQMQLPFWAFTAWFMYRGLTRGRAADWLLAGACLAGAFWSKYAVFALVASLGLFLLLDSTARRAWRTVGPYLMALAFLIVAAPNLWWLIDHNFLPLRYIDERAVSAENALQYLFFPLRWTSSQLLYLTPTILLLALLCGRPEWTPPGGDKAAFDRRYVTMLALGPFAVVTLLFGVTGRLPVAIWGYPLWSFAPLAVLLWLPPVDEKRRLRRFAAGAIAILALFPLAYVAVEMGEPLLRDRRKATTFPGQTLADTVTRAWRGRFITPLTYVGGTEFAANNVAVYSADRPHVIVHSDLSISPWVDPAELRRRGGVLVWQPELAGNMPDQWRASFQALAVEPELILPQQAWVKGKLAPMQVRYALIPPRP